MCIRPELVETKYCVNIQIVLHYQRRAPTSAQRLGLLCSQSDFRKSPFPCTVFTPISCIQKCLLKNQRRRSGTHLTAAVTSRVLVNRKRVRAQRAGRVALCGWVRREAPAQRRWMPRSGTQLAAARSAVAPLQAAERRAGEKGMFFCFHFCEY